MSDTSLIYSYSFLIKGAVQGVGFRPFVYKTAAKFGINGFVINDANGVYIEAEGSLENLDFFENSLKFELPPLARVDFFEKKELILQNFTNFTIKKSNSSKSPTTQVLPDFAICEDCQKEFYDKNNSRFLYPFINCTNCGPRYSIIKNLPYDRHNTTMDKFKMCRSCQNEYESPLDRRYHAQPISCLSCGPSLSLHKNTGEIISKDDVIFKISEKIKEKKIVAIKGLGGFHIICDARDDEVIKRLRVLKNRPLKPFAIMCKNQKTAKELAQISAKEQEVLSSIHKPIVLLNSKQSNKISNLVAPDINKIGIFLPYTGIHLLLFEYIDFAIIATSANLSGEPIITNSNDLVKKLSNVIDFYVDYDREIINASDDSVVQIVDEKVVFLRLSRGFAPRVYKTNFNFKKQVLALGAQQKNQICFYKEGQIYQSPYIGDMEKNASYEYFLKTVQSFSRFYELRIEQILADKHPNFTLNSWAKEQKKPILTTQHHFAHIKTAMFENNLQNALGVAFDGTGYGDDGSIWGGEFLLCENNNYKRVAYFEPFKLIGGDKGIKDLEKLTFSMLYEQKDEKSKEFISKLKQSKLLSKIYQENINTINCSSVGRIFDVLYYIMTAEKTLSYDAQSGMYLEKYYDENIKESYDFILENEVIKYKHILPLMFSETKAEISSKFLNALSDIILKIIQIYNKPAVLSGGVFQNKTLLQILFQKAKQANLKLYIPANNSPNDGSISFGQMVNFLQQNEKK